MSDKSFRLSDGSSLQWFEKDASNYLDLATIIYGETGTGKTTIITEIMYLLKPYIPTIFVISASNDSNEAYTGIVPPRCIKTSVKKEWFISFWSRQEQIMQIYKIVNNIKNLYSVFIKIANQKYINIANKITQAAQNKIRLLESNNLPYAKKRSQRNNIIKRQNTELIKLYKSAIRQYKKQLLLGPLTQIQKNVVKYLDLNPRALIVFDDVTEFFKIWINFFKGKDSSQNPFNSMLYRGRHVGITIIISTHNDKAITPELRKNSRVSIFTRGASAICHFEKHTNGYSKNERKKINTIVSDLFECDNNENKTYQKLVYVRESTKPFKYMVADIYPEFRMGSKSLWKIDEKIPNKEADKLKENPYFN